MIEDKTEPIFGTLSIEQNDLTKCLKEDETLNKNLNQAISFLDENDFAFFDLALSQEESEALTLMQVKEFKNWALFDDKIELLPEFSKGFVQNFALPKENAEKAPVISKVITKIVRSVISESQYDSCKVMLRVYPPDTNHNKLQWHIDKNHEEIIGLDSTRLQLSFYITLKGSYSTLFRSVPASFNETWRNELTNESEQGFAYEITSPFLNESLIFSAIPGKQGSVHKLGQMHGTIHARPYPENGRVVLLITPGNQTVVRALQYFENYHFQASFSNPYDP